MENSDAWRWKLLYEDLDQWKKTYLSFSRIPEKGLLGEITLKAIFECKRQLIRNSPAYTDEEKKVAEEFFTDTLVDYNPDIYLGKFDDRALISLEFSSKSHLYEKFGNEVIRGKYLGLVNNHTTQLKNNKGSYENVECEIAFRFAYPTINDVFIIAFRDLEIAESFNLY